MALTGEKVAQVEIKSCGDAFHTLFRHKPHHVSNVIPHIVQGCDLHEGEWGTVGSVISWNYFHDGRNEYAKEIVEDINEEKRSITFKIIEGDLLELYKTFSFTVHVDKKGQGSLVTWTLNYEKLNESIPDPDTLLDYFINLTKEIEVGHLKE